MCFRILVDGAKLTLAADPIVDMRQYLGAGVYLTNGRGAGQYREVVAADGRAMMHALRLAGQTETIFVEQIGDMPQTIMQWARDGDVIITMGAGSIGNVPAAVKQLA